MQNNIKKLFRAESRELTTTYCCNIILTISEKKNEKKADVWKARLREQRTASSAAIQTSLNAKNKQLLQFSRQLRTSFQEIGKLKSEKTTLVVKTKEVIYRNGCFLQVSQSLQLEKAISERDAIISTLEFEKKDLEEKLKRSQQDTQSIKKQVFESLLHASTHLHRPTLVTKRCCSDISERFNQSKSETLLCVCGVVSSCSSLTHTHTHTHTHTQREVGFHMRT